MSKTISILFFPQKSGVSKVSFTSFYRVKTNFRRNLLIKPKKLTFDTPLFLKKKYDRNCF